jgi:hypothetical protein
MDDASVVVYKQATSGILAHELGKIAREPSVASIATPSMAVARNDHAP